MSAFLKHGGYQVFGTYIAHPAWIDFGLQELNKGWGEPEQS